VLFTGWKQCFLQAGSSAFYRLETVSFTGWKPILQVALFTGWNQCFLQAGSSAFYRLKAVLFTG
jgi:hypothetical protein